MSTEKKTVLYDWHVEQGANMAGFGGYEMPLWYKAGAKKEHLAVIEAAGVFDTSHMALLTLEGEGCFELLQRTFTKDLSCCLGPKKNPLVPGRCVYGMFLDENGHVVDDAIVYKVKDDMFMLVVNAGMGPVIVEHLKQQGADKVTIKDYSDQLGKIDIQGKATLPVLKKLLADPAMALEKFIYFSYKGCFEPGKADPKVLTKGGIEILISRTGYTGEFGVEIFVEGDKTAALWQEILACGEEFGLLPCGLAARDSLRAGAGLPLSHQDIGGWCFSNTPWDFVLPTDQNGAYTKEFLGDKATRQASQYTYAFAGFDPRKIPAGEGSQVESMDGEVIGEILTCTTDMAVGRLDGEIVSTAERRDFVAKGLSCGFIKVSGQLTVGTEVMLVAGKRKVKVEIRDDIRPARTARMSVKLLEEKLMGEE